MIASLQTSFFPASSGTASSTDALKHHKLTDAAQQFEGMFLQQMLKPISTEGGSDGDDGDEKLEGGSSYSSLGVEAMARAVSAAGGFGIAKSIVSSVEKESRGRLDTAEKVRQS